MPDPGDTPDLGTETRNCETCGRPCQHTPDGKVQPHRRPVPGSPWCEASPARPGRGRPMRVDT